MELTIAEAARRLGISKEAMRSRVQRRRIQARKGADGQWYVIVSDDADASSRPTAGATDATDATGAIGPEATDGLNERVWEAIREEVHFLRDQNIQQARVIEEMQRDHAREVQELHVLLQNTQRLIPATVPDAPHAPERAGDGVSGVASGNVSHSVPQRESEASQRPSRRSSWWSRLFGLE